REKFVMKMLSWGAGDGRCAADGLPMLRQAKPHRQPSRRGTPRRRGVPNTGPSKWMSPTNGHLPTHPDRRRIRIVQGDPIALEPPVERSASVHDQPQVVDGDVVRARLRDLFVDT